MKVAPPTDAEVTEALDRAAGLLVAASAEILRRIPEVDRRKLWERDGATCTASWLSARYRLTKGNAREWVRVARKLQELPLIAEAYACGRLSWDQIQPLTRFATRDTDKDWADRAADRSPASLWCEARRHERVRRKEAEEARRLRYLHFWRDEDHRVVWLEGALPSEEGAAVEAALARRAEELSVEDGLSDPQGARMADALVELLSGDENAAPTLVVHVDAAALAGEGRPRGPWLAETSTGHRVSADVIRRLACDSRIELVLESRGRPVGIGRRGRQVPGHIGRVLRHRDGFCRFPGCERKRWLKVHHLIHWADGGATDLDNLVLLCHAHHRLLHEGGWGTTGHPARNLRFHDPGGRPLRTTPPALRPELRARYFP